jgi:hypothetical protein
MKVEVPFFTARLRLALTAFAALAILLARGQLAAVAAPSVVAGSGKLGIDDGPALGASFLMPSGLAVGRDGVLYVADEAAQRIRSISAGTVRTEAGSAQLTPDGFSAEPGYRDGPALQALFNKPCGVAVSASGAIYIADSGNGAIRVLQRGVVTTLLGTPNDRVAKDGSLVDARFHDPRALAFDSAGNLYVADYTVGIRRIDRQGVVTTIDASAADKRIWGLAVWNDPDEPILYASTPDELIVRSLRDGHEDTYGRTILNEDGGPFGAAYQLAPLGDRKLLFSDLLAGSVRIYRGPAPPFFYAPLTRTIAGGDSAAARDNRGSAAPDSPRPGRLWAPAGIAVSGSVAYVADAASRRILKVDVPRMMVPEDGLRGMVPPDGRHLDVAVIGPSYSYWDSIGDDSICGQLERRANIGPNRLKPLRCHAVRIDGAGLPQLADYSKNFLSNMDAIVVLTDAVTLNDERRNPSVFAHGKPADPARAAAEFRAYVRDVFLPALGAPKTKTFLMVVAPPNYFSDGDLMYDREMNENDRVFPADAHDLSNSTNALLDALQGLPVVVDNRRSALLDDERRADAQPITGADDIHPTIYGNQELGSWVYQMLANSGFLK